MSVVVRLQLGRPSDSERSWKGGLSNYSTVPCIYVGFMMNQATRLYKVAEASSVLDKGLPREVGTYIGTW